MTAPMLKLAMFKAKTHYAAHLPGSGLFGVYQYLQTHKYKHFTFVLPKSWRRCPYFILQWNCLYGDGLISSRAFPIIRGVYECNISQGMRKLVFSLKDACIVGPVLKI